MDINERPSRFKDCGQDAAQEWLIHPVTVRIEQIILRDIEEAENALYAYACDKSRCTSIESDQEIASSLKSFGSGFEATKRVLGLFEEARSYAKGK